VDTLFAGDLMLFDTFESDNVSKKTLTTQAKQYMLVIRDACNT